MQQYLIKFTGIDLASDLFDMRSTIEDNATVDTIKHIRIAYVENVITVTTEDDCFTADMLQVDGIIASTGDHRDGQLLIGIEVGWSFFGHFTAREHGVLATNPAEFFDGNGQFIVP